MNDEDSPRSAAARAAPELALVRVVHHYGGRPEFVCSAAWCPRCYVQGRHGDTPERPTLMFRSTLKSLAAQYEPPVWNKRCATPSLSRAPSASGDGTSPTRPACGPWSN